MLDRLLSSFNYGQFISSYFQPGGRLSHQAPTEMCFFTPRHKLHIEHLRIMGILKCALFIGRSNTFCKVDTVSKRLKA